MAPTVKLLQDLDIANDFEFAKPTKMNDGTRWCACKGPLIQTDDMQISCKKGVCTVLCNDDYADAIAHLEEHAIEQIANNSLNWFRNALSYEDVETMLRASLRGHRVPRHTVSCASMRSYTHELAESQVAEDEPVTAACILQVRGILMQESKCELQFEVRQTRMAAPPDNEAHDPEPEEVTLDAPVFV